MQEKQSTSTSNLQYDVISVLYHSLESAQTCEAYVKDAQQGGNQDLVNFFKGIQQSCDKQAERAKDLLGQMRSSR